MLFLGTANKMHTQADSPSGDYTFIPNRGRWIATKLTANGDVSSGTESTLLQTAPDSADAQWVSAADHRDGSLLHEGGPCTRG